MLMTLLQCIGSITRLPNAKTRSLSEGFVPGRNLEVYGGGICAICCSSAVFNSSGNCLPRRDARRKMPSQALRLKKYFSGTHACKIEDKRDAQATLGNAPVLGIHSSPRQRVVVCQNCPGAGPFDPPPVRP